MNQTLKIDWLEKKDENWKLATLTSDTQSYADVSINRTSKKGDVFPGFDELQPGGTVEGILWQSQGGKWYLFPPKAKTTPTGASRGSQFIAKAQETKRQDIEKAQTNKEFGIKVASTMSGAIQLAISEFNSLQSLEQNIRPTLEFLIEKWRKYLWMTWDKEDKDYEPF